jgi:adenylylsulfate kinase-like enzyme/2-polyprenyl-3-methyl-5-hydroxy-6-metoxy-1,4-benzoquinol methylase
MSSDAPDGTADELDTSTPSGVIWITGYSSAGKTSIGRMVAAALQRSGTPSIFLDGDDLRGILGGRGYSDEERRELARVYFRLCSHIAAQEVVVVIAAAAMYREVYDWFFDNVPRGMLVYADVPEGVRRRRDAAARKRVYEAEPSKTATYQPPVNADLVVENPDGADLGATAGRIVEAYRVLREPEADHGRAAHWDSAYASRSAPLDPTSFAVLVSESLSPAERSLIEVGCGNGRDAAHFADAGLSVTAIDASPRAIELCRELHGARISFEQGKLDELDLAPGSFDVVYARFVLHAMTPQEEQGFHAAAAAVLRPGGRVFIEARSIHDPLARRGEVISPTERIHGHYRRFIVPEELAAGVEAAGFAVDSMVESSGVAVLGDDDPVVIRMTARRAG